MTLEQRIELFRCNVDAHALRLRRLVQAGHDGSQLLSARNDALSALERLGGALAERERELLRVVCPRCGARTLRGAASSCSACGTALPGQLPLLGAVLAPVPG